MAITANNYDYSVFGNKAAVVADLAFDSAYSYGGDTLEYEKFFGLHEIDLALIEGKNGYSFQYEDGKIKVFAPAPPVVYDEHQVADPDTGAITLKYPAAFIMNVAIPEQNLAMRSTGVTLANLGSNQCALSAQMAAGLKTGLICKPSLDGLGTDGAFTGGTTNWTFDAAPWTYGTNNLNKDANGANTLAHDTFACVVGRTYKVTFTLSSWTVGTITPSLGGVAGTAVGADGTFSQTFKATAVTGLVFTPSNTARFTIDTISVVCQDVFVTYVTQAWKEVWENLVQDESVTLASGATADLSYAPCAVMYADQITATAAALTLIDEDDTAASGEVAIYFNQATAAIKATHADQNAKVAKITYIKNPGSGFLYDRAFDNEGATKAGGDPYTNTFDYPVLIWGYAGQVPINGGATQRLINYAGTPAAGEAVIDWFNPGTRGAAAPATGTVVGLKSDVTGTAAGIWGRIDELVTVPLEVVDVNLSALTSVKALFIGL